MNAAGIAAAGAVGAVGAPAGAGEARPLPLNATRLIARARAGARADRLGFLLGLGFGLLLVLVRVHEYDTIHALLTLRDPYVFLLMGSAVATAAPLLWLLRRRRWRTPYGEPYGADVPPPRRARAWRRRGAAQAVPLAYSGR